MSLIRIPCNYVASIDPAGALPSFLYADLKMTEAQMFEALNSMLANVSGETWAKWVEQINAEVAA